ncbi:hypothetical protein QEJ31_11385 [Pigmentibacter sp. JX0631]|uniref:hypothetical protein n=1 Tax=Pigmentibacter sp. JX0631 TaxID=2976982 RepID=UPI0024696789|nr:hypothetical protein [Pigmentibacter sp. JX0631]WGL59123.1 hypothetical protein QEJ31_11385 [Pigmentibacter sp. JX0631]
MNLIKKTAISIIVLTILNSCGEGASSSKNSQGSADDRALKNAECNNINSKKVALFEQLSKLENANNSLVDLYYTKIGNTSAYYGLNSTDENNLKGIMLVENSNVNSFRYTATNVLETITNYCSKDYMQYSDVKKWKDFMNNQFSETIQVLKNNYNKISSDISNVRLKNDLIPLYQNGILNNCEGLDKFL